MRNAWAGQRTIHPPARMLVFPQTVSAGPLRPVNRHAMNRPGRSKPFPFRVNEASAA